MHLIIHTSINTPPVSVFIHYFSMYCKYNHRLNPRSSLAYSFCSSNLALLLCFTHFNISTALTNVAVQILKADLGAHPTTYQLCNEVYTGDKAAAA